MGFLSIRIVILVDGQVYPNRIGGAEIFAYRLSEMLAQRGHEIHLFARKQSFSVVLRQKNVQTHSLLDLKPLTLLRMIQCFLLSLKIQPQLVLSVMAHSALLGHCMSKATSCPHIIQFTGLDVELLSMHNRPLVGWLLNSIPVQLCRKSSWFIALSDRMAKKIIKPEIPRTNIKIIPNLVDNSFFRINSNLDENNIVFIGRLVPEKGLTNLIKAFSSVRYVVDDSNLLIVGDGPLRKELEMDAKSLSLDDCVHFCGFVPYDQIGSFLSKATIFVIPSLVEGMPLSLLQAMAAGVPVIATSVGSIPDVIENNVDGLLVPPNDVNALSEAMIDLLRDKNKAKSLSELSRKNVKRYSIDVIVQSYEDLFNLVVAGT